MCVVFSSHSFWTSSSLDVPAGVTQEEAHTGFFIHLPSAVRALIFLARRIQPFLSLVDSEVEFCVLTIQSFSTRLAFYFYFLFFGEKNPVCRDRTYVLTCQKVTRLPLSYRGDRLRSKVGPQVSSWYFFLFLFSYSCSFLFWTSSSLDVPAGVTQEGHTGFLIHLPSAVRTLIFLTRRIQPFLSLVDREVEFCGLMLSLYTCCWAYFYFFLVRKIPFAEIRTHVPTRHRLRGHF